MSVNGPSVEEQELRYLASMLRDFRELVRKHREAEMKVAMVLDHETGEPEIIFAGFTVKRPLEPLRQTYRIRKANAAAR